MIRRGLRISTSSVLSLQTPFSSSLTKRPISTNVHIRGIPLDLTESDVYKLVSSYGSIKGLAVYKEPKEHPTRNDDSNQASSITENDGNKGSTTFQNGVPGQTAIVGFNSTNSAISCKEELHWRPIAVDGSHTIDERLLKLDARDRPLVSVQFQNSAMRSKVRGWVKKNFDLSWMKIRDWEKEDTHGKK